MLLYILVIGLFIICFPIKVYIGNRPFAFSQDTNFMTIKQYAFNLTSIQNEITTTKKPTFTMTIKPTLLTNLFFKKEFKPVIKNKNVTTRKPNVYKPLSKQIPLRINQISNPFHVTPSPKNNRIPCFLPEYVEYPFYYPSISIKKRQQQQDRYIAFLNAYNNKKYTNSTTGRYLLYSSHPDSGLGNVVRGFLTTFFVSITSDHILCFNASLPYFDFFFKPFSNLDNYYIKTTIYHKSVNWVLDTYQGLLFYRIPTSRLYKHRLIDFLTYSDVTMSYLNPVLYRSYFESIGFIPELDEDINNRWLGQMFHAAVIPLFLNPREDICHIINSHIEKLHSKTLIGLQIRVGGSSSNYKERTFLGDNAYVYFVNNMMRYMKQQNLTRENTYLFISTDSDIVIQNITQTITSTGINFIYTVNDYSIGHSAYAKTSSKGYDIWGSYFSRSIVDLLILKESDYLIFSKGSSFGRFAYELQQFYNNPISPDPFLRQQGLNCSVFGHRTKAGQGMGLLKKDVMKPHQLEILL